MSPAIETVVGPNLTTLPFNLDAKLEEPTRVMLIPFSNISSNAGMVTRVVSLKKEVCSKVAWEQDKLRINWEIKPISYIVVRKTQGISHFKRSEI